MSTLKIIALANGEPSPFDGMYVAEYDPTRPGVDPDGNYMTAHLVCTPERERALDLPTDQILEVWKRSHGIRPWDGRPNRPLIAFTVVVEP